MTGGIAARGFDAALARFAQGLAVIGVAALLAQACGIVIDALLRSVFGSPIHGLEDINLLLIPVTVASFLPVLVLARGHVRVDLLGRRLSRGAARRLDLFGHLGAFVFLLLLAYGYFDHARALGTQHTVIIELPLRPAAFAAAVFIALAALFEGVVLIRLLLRKGAP